MPESGPSAQAQQDIRAAQALPDNLARREHVHAVQQRARALLLDVTSTPEQKSAARLDIRQALALTGDLDSRAPPAPLTWIAAPALKEAATPLVRQHVHVGDRMNEQLADPVADAPHAT
ncbi:hypothetical protein [Mycobacterium intracellulare]|jgi:hypothetical protein|uniref:hypothetical protein n=1 Tax=Mycobacterium intracellulare TaxID=1767 RepID=UPI0011AB744F|nr:hypothetical protein [Mycobacterium intracellulare]